MWGKVTPLLSAYRHQCLVKNGDIWVIWEKVLQWLGGLLWSFWGVGIKSFWVLLDTYPWSGKGCLRDHVLVWVCGQSSFLSSWALAYEKPLTTTFAFYNFLSTYNTCSRWRFFWVIWEFSFTFFKYALMSPDVSFLWICDLSPPYYFGFNLLKIPQPFLFLSRSLCLPVSHLLDGVNKRVTWLK